MLVSAFFTQNLMIMKQNVTNTISRDILFKAILFDSFLKIDISERMIVADDWVTWKKKKMWLTLICAGLIKEKNLYT